MEAFLSDKRDRDNKLSSGDFTMKNRDLVLPTTKGLVVREYIPATLISECPPSVIAVIEEYRWVFFIELNLK